MDDIPNKKSLTGGVLNKDISDSELLLEIEVTDSLCSALLNENKKGESLVEVTIIQPDRLKTPSILASTPEHEKKKIEAQQQIDKKMNELISKMKTLTKNPNNFTKSDEETQKNMRQQFLATLGLKSLIEPNATVRQNNSENQNYKNCASQTSNYLLENLINPIKLLPRNFKIRQDNKVEVSKYSSLNCKNKNSKTTCTVLNKNLSNSSTQTIDESTEPKFIKEKFKNKYEQMNENLISIPVKLCSSQSQEFLKQFIKHFDDNKIENEINNNSQTNALMTNSSVKLKKKPKLLRKLSFIKIKKSAISFKKRNSKKLNKNPPDRKVNEITIKKGDIFECLNHIPKINTQQNFNMHISKPEKSIKRRQENPMLLTISKLEDQLTSLPLERKPLWQISPSQECFHSRDTKSISGLKEKVVSSKGTHHQNSSQNLKLQNEQENEKSIQKEINIETYKQNENKPSSLPSRVNSDHIIESTSDWLTIDDENESENRQKFNSTCSFELQGGEQEQRRVDFIPDPWHPFCREHHRLQRDPDRPSRRRYGSGAWTRPWSAPAPSSHNLPKGSVWFWDGSKLRPGYDLRSRVENILLNELGQNVTNEEAEETLTRLPLHRLTGTDADMPTFMNNSSLSRIIELKQSLERPHLPPAPPLENIASSFKQKANSKSSLSLSHLRYVDLERDPPKRSPEPERQIYQQEYVAITAPPPNNNSYKESSHSTKSLHVTYLNPLLQRLSKKYQGARSHSPHYHQPPSYEKQSKKSQHKRKNRSFRNDSNLNIPNSTGANLHEHHIYELMRTAQKRQLRKLSDDPNDFEIELEVTGKDLCRVLGMNNDTNLRKSRDTQIKQNRTTPSRSPSPKKFFNSRSTDLNNQHFKFRVHEKHLNKEITDKIASPSLSCKSANSHKYSHLGYKQSEKSHSQKSSPQRENSARGYSYREIKKISHRKPNYYKNPEASTSGVKHPASGWVKPNKNM